MYEGLNQFLSKYSTFNQVELNDIASRFKPRKVKKGGFLLKPGGICKDFYFVQDGCIRLFYIANEIDISVWFAFMNSTAIDISSFIRNEPSQYFLQAIEPGEVLFLPKPDIQELYKVHPKMQEMMRNFWEDALLQLIDRFTALQRDPAEKRYLDLLTRPPYLQKIPQKYLASFIGVTPTSLSRIRKCIK